MELFLYEGRSGSEEKGTVQYFCPLFVQREQAE